MRWRVSGRPALPFVRRVTRQDESGLREVHFARQGTQPGDCPRRDAKKRRRIVRRESGEGLGSWPVHCSASRVQVIQATMPNGSIWVAC